MKKPLKGITKNPYARRLSISLAGISSGSRYAVGGINNWFKSDEAKASANEALLKREAERFTQELGKLKGAYVKIGQMLAIYGQHVLPKALTDAFLQLNDQTPPLAWPVINACLKQQLGVRYTDFDIDPIPVAAASLAQVHQGVRKSDGQKICFKVQYPHVANTIESDFGDFIRLMHLARWLSRDDTTEGVLDEVKSLLKQEVDYHYEANISELLTGLLTHDPRYLIPKIYPQYSTGELLVMDYIDGHKLNSAEVKQLSQTRRNALGLSLLDLFMKELFEWNLLQTDPNFGNYLVCNETLALLDFGAVRAFDPVFMDGLCRTIAGAVQLDEAQTIKGLLQIGFYKAGQASSVKASLVELCYLLVEPLRPRDERAPTSVYNDEGEYLWAQSSLVRRAAKLAAKSATSVEFSLPPKEFALVTRKLSGVFSTIAELDAKINASDLVQTYIDTWQATP